MLHRSATAFPPFLDRHLAPGGPVRRSPNGALEIDQGRIGDEELSAALARPTETGIIQGAGVFPSIGPFPTGRLYYIQYPDAYQKKMRQEVSFRAGRGSVQPPWPGEFELDRLEVTVGFRSRPGKRARIAFADAVAAWALAAGERGAFDDGPVVLASPDVSFNGTRAWFRIDARRSGQDTLNWLALAVLDFGEAVHTTVKVKFGEAAEILDLDFGPIRGDIEVIRLAGDRREETVTASSDPAPVGHVPASARRAKGVPSARFAVLALAHYEWDTFVATIYFGRAFVRDEREDLARLLDAWLLLGSYGGLGGTGIHGADEVAFDEATDSATIRADMGDADPRTALRVLFRSLEGYESSAPSIEAVVLGKHAIFR